MNPHGPRASPPPGTTFSSPGPRKGLKTERHDGPAHRIPVIYFLRSSLRNLGVQAGLFFLSSFLSKRPSFLLLKLLQFQH